MLDLHTLFSPSSLTRRFACLGSANAEKGLLDQPNENSCEGVAAHGIREKCLLNNTDVEDYLGEKIIVHEWEFEVTREWVNLLQPGIDRLRDQSRKKGARLFVEHKVDLNTWMPGEKGTLDAGITSPTLITIDDLKFGRNWVSAIESNQMSGYSLGFIEKYVGFDNPKLKVRMQIDQPRAFGGGSEWETTVAELLEFGERLKELYKKASDPNAPRTPTLEGCPYCKAMTTCREFATYFLELLRLELEDKFVIPKAQQLTHQELGKILAHVSLLNSAIIAYKEYGKNLMLEQAVELPMVKCVEGPGSREWTDEEEVRAFLEGKYKLHQIEDRKLKSPAQMENVLGTRNWAKIQEFIINKDGSPQLVKASDPRPALIPVINLFDDEDDDVLSEFEDDFSDFI